ncbi:MAG: glutamate--tRNA ligase, partial [Cyclobacteriaceae bacterium]|nr:glutamate--tRNA ligase [Cyclobacteriaceae bacterium]
VLAAYGKELQSASGLTAESAKAILDTTTSMHNMKAGQVLQVLRMVLTGQGAGPDLMMSIEIMGSAEVAQRIEFAIRTITK